MSDNEYTGVASKASPEKIAIKLSLGEFGASHETQIVLGDKDITKFVKGYNLIGKAGNLAELHLELAPRKTQEITASLRVQDIKVRVLGIDLFRPWLRHGPNCTNRDCLCGLTSMLEDFDPYAGD